MIPFYENDYLEHDLLRGTVANRAGTKMCYMPAELVLGLIQILQEETGEEWRKILHRVGRIWGRRVAKRFQKEIAGFFGRPLHEMPVREFLPVLEGYFGYHGWGRLKVDLTHAEAGYIMARLENSAFVEILGASEEPVDSIVCGLLSEFFGQISERTDIDCVETECAARGRPSCHFVIGIEARLAAVRRMSEEGMAHDQIVASICPKAESSLNDSDTQELSGRSVL